MNSPSSAHDSLASRIDALLPQTQCKRCGFDGCRPYADALAAGRTSFNRCPPGGEPTMVRLAELLGREPMALDPECGPSGPWRVAVVDEPACIGCTLCIQVCPVDAIVGAGKLMHTVLEDECTGCELCVAPCPVDCIDMVPMRRPRADGEFFLQEWMRARAPLARRRHAARAVRLERERMAAASRRRRASAAVRRRVSLEEKRAAIEAAVARSRSRRVNRGRVT